MKYFVKGWYTKEIFLVFIWYELLCGILYNINMHVCKAPVTRWPSCDHGDPGNPQNRRVVAGYQKPLLRVTAIGIVVRSHGALVHDLCEPSCVSATTSASAWHLYYDLMAPRTRAQCDHQRSKCDRTATLLWLRWPQYAAWALPLRLLRTHGIRTTILQQPSVFGCVIWLHSMAIWNVLISYF